MPKPYVELAIQIARGSSEFLKKNLVDALAELKDESLRATLDPIESPRCRRADRLCGMAGKGKIAESDPAICDRCGKISAFSGSDRAGRSCRPTKILELGLSELKREQEVFAEAAKKIDPNKTAYEVFRQIQSEHPTAENLLPEITKKLESVRKYVVDSKLVTIPTEIRAQVKEAPQYHARDQFCFDGYARSIRETGRGRLSATSAAGEAIGLSNKRTNG